MTAELVDARNGFRVWTETYEHELDSAFALQDEIARSIADALKIKLAVRPSAQEQPGNGPYDPYLQRLFTDVTHPTGISNIGISVPVQNPSNPSTVPDYTSPERFDSRRPDTRGTAAPPQPGVTTSVRYRASEAGLRTNKVTAEVIAAPPETAFNSSVRDRALGAGLRTTKLQRRTLLLQGRESLPLCVIAHRKPARERTKLQRTRQRPFRGLSKMQKANRLRAQTFGSNRETANRCSAQSRPIQRAARFHRGCNGACTG